LFHIYSGIVPSIGSIAITCERSSIAKDQENGIIYVTLNFCVSLKSTIRNCDFTIKDVGYDRHVTAVTTKLVGLCWMFASSESHDVPATPLFQDCSQGDMLQSTCFQLGELLSFEDTGDNSATIQPKESGLTHGVFEEIVAESYIYEKT